MPEALLSAREVTIRFGGIIALDNVSFDVPDGSIVGLIGPNGAGKTTLFNCVTRLYTPTSGHIYYRGEDLLTVPAHNIVRRGIARTFQNVELFPRMSVLQNVLVGDHIHIGGSRWSAIPMAVGWPSSLRDEREARERDRKSTRLNSSHYSRSRMPSSA